MRLRFSRSLVLSGLVSLALVDPSFVDRTVASEPVDFGPLEARYLREVRPLLAARCNDCHATSDPQGELDLDRLDPLGPASLAAVGRDGGRSPDASCRCVAAER